MAKSPRKTLTLPAKTAGDTVPERGGRRPVRAATAPRRKPPVAPTVSEPSASGAGKADAGARGPRRDAGDAGAPRRFKSAGDGAYGKGRPAAAGEKRSAPRSERPPRAGDAPRRDGERTDRALAPRRDGGRRTPSERGDSAQRFERSGRPPRDNTSERPARPERAERADRPPRANPPERAGSGGRPERGTDPRRAERGESSPYSPRVPRTPRTPPAANTDTRPGSAPFKGSRAAPGDRASLAPRAPRSDGGWRQKVPAAPAQTSAALAPTPLTPTSVKEGVRVSKLLSERGMCSRREADDYIANGWVFVDGQRISELGARAPATAVVSLAAEAQERQTRRVTILLHKPVGYVSGQPEPGCVPAVKLILPENEWATPGGLRFQPRHLQELAPAGRLDIDSTGLLVLTQDGRVARALIGDDSSVDKEYLVRVEGTLSDEGLRLLRHGLSLDGKELRPAQVEWQNEDQLRFILREGRKRQIRRMCELVGLTVVGLKRVRIGGVRLGDLPLGQWRYLGDNESF
ncbi:pseudouridine synthase [Rhodocyclus tenuis]|uniref:pseudouridine synthase n=1 Tax=Rhodocyclus gracilis TaxID=2929842 RepID=UPI001298A317|nr:pseudouridine synthase [Rhodocyclus gracilis]MRD74162.1 pseudouridine synthase [Rhodocyclus gracilis]